MFNVLLDELPEDYEGYPVNTDFRIGIQLSQLLADHDMGNREKAERLCDLLFPGIIPENTNDAVKWFLGGWYTDNQTKTKETQEIMDYDADQWRIYSAFRQQYGIDLNTANMHYWVFMGLLSNLEVCAFKRIMDIRQKKIDSKMSKEEKEALKEAKKIYQLEAKEECTEESYERKLKEQEAADVFRSFVK